MGIRDPFLVSFALVLIIFGLNSANCYSHCPGFENAEELGPPKLILSKAVIHSQNENEIFINMSKVISFNLDCWASYPIDFRFTGHLTNQRNEVRTKVSTFRKSDDEVTTFRYCYHINVTLESYKEITGNYTCFNVGNHSLASSKYVFVHGIHPSFLLRSREHVKIGIEPGQRSVILPCATSDGSKGVTLFKEIQPNIFSWVLESSSLLFDPKIGYKMQLSPATRRHQQELGKYQCRVDGIRADRDFVNVTLEASPPFLVYPIPERLLTLKLGDRLVLECHSRVDNSNISFQSIPDIGLEEDDDFSLSKNSHFKDQLQFYKASKMLFSKPFSSVMTGQVECIQKGVSIAQWFYKVVNSSRKAGGELETSKLLNFCPSSSKNSSTFSSLNLIYFECDNMVSCRMSQCLRNDPTCQSNAHCHHSLCIPNGILQCRSEDGVVSEIFFTGFDNVKYTNWKSADTKAILRIRSKMTSPYLSLTCEGTNFAFASGFRWFFQMHNGEDLELNSDRFAKYIKIKETWGDRKSIIRSELALLQWKNMDISSITCSAPVWNDTIWINQTIRMQDVLDDNGVGVGGQASIIALPSRTWTFTPTFIFILIRVGVDHHNLFS